MTDRAFVQFRVRGSTYALPVESVAEIVRVVSLAAVPGAHPEVLGVANLRGRAVPVVDLARVLGQGSRPVTLRMYVVVADIGGELVGALVDDVDDVVTVPAGNVQSSRALAGDGSFAAAVARVGGSLLTVLDLAPLLDSLGAETRAPRS